MFAYNLVLATIFQLLLSIPQTVDEIRPNHPNGNWFNDHMLIWKKKLLYVASDNELAGYDPLSLFPFHNGIDPLKNQRFCNIE